MTDISESWEKILELIEANIGISKRTIELIAVKDILVLSASGVCNHQISSVLDLDYSYVKGVLREFLDFDGWDNDLDLNPYSIYINLVSKGYTKLGDFEAEIGTISPYMNDERLVNNAFNICHKLYEIEQKIEKEWK